MAFFRDKTQCPFCNSDQFVVSLFVNDMPKTDDPSTLGERLSFSCAQCGKLVFRVTNNKGKVVSAEGVSICEKCNWDLFELHDSWREEDILMTTYPVGTNLCPKCNSQLRICWWRGWNYTV